ncbi:MAG: TetR/AcrR family transcriptional regulator [Chloroflexia bacterium]|nr:TetR/AcrR family transcriptional regulator [Chloroflexia bacterium]
MARGITRTQVIDCAATLVNNHGFAALSLAQIASQTGVKVPSLYNYVTGIDDVRLALATRGAQAILAVVVHAAVGRAGGEAIMAVALAYRTYIVRNPGVYAATIQPNNPDPDFLHANGELLRVLTQILAPYHLSAHDLIHALRGLRSVVHGFATLEISGGFGMPVDLDASFAQMVQTFIGGLTRSE